MLEKAGLDAPARAHPPALEAIASGTPRVLEIGKNNLFGNTDPARHMFYNGYLHRPVPDEPGRRQIGVRTISGLLAALRGHAHDVVLVYPHRHAPWSPEMILRMLGRSRVIHLPSLVLQACSGPLAMLARDKPIAVVDLDDTTRLPRHWLPLLHRASLIFKRELPADHWATFMGVGHRDLPSSGFRARSPLRAVVTKLRPISLGVPRQVEPIATRLLPPEKTIDVFFAGSLRNWGTVRERGLAQLQQLAASGLKVEILDRVLPLDQYLARCAASWLVWSPQGLGWDCYRHYEAAACGSVPVINNSTIERHAPFVHGEHCFYYDVEGDALQHVIHAALADKERLRAVGEAARAHVAEHHTAAAIGRHIVETTLAAAAGR